MSITGARGGTLSRKYDVDHKVGVKTDEGKTI